MQKLNGLAQRLWRFEVLSQSCQRAYCAFFAPRSFQSGQRRAELAGGKGFEGAEAGGELGGIQVALAVEPAEKIIGRLFSFLRVAKDRLNTIAGPEENREQKEKGQNRVKPQFYPRVIIHS